MKANTNKALISEVSTTYGIRTRDSSVKGRRLNPLTNAAFLKWTAKIVPPFFVAKSFICFALMLNMNKKLLLYVTRLACLQSIDT